MDHTHTEGHLRDDPHHNYLISARHLKKSFSNGGVHIDVLKMDLIDYCRMLEKSMIIDLIDSLLLQ